MGRRGIGWRIAFFGLAGIFSFVLMALTSVAFAAPATISMAVSSARATVGQTVTLTVSVTSTTGQPPTGRVKFSVNGMVVREVDLSPTAVLDITAPAPGQVSVRAEYLGDGIHDPISTFNTIQVYPPITFSPSSLPGLVAGIAYSQTVLASGGTAPYTYAISDGRLPDGLSLYASSGVISGTPREIGTFKFKVHATDSTSFGPFTSEQSYSLEVKPARLSLVTTIPDAATGSPYQHQLKAEGGIGPYHFQLVGSPPPGLSLTTDGVLAGTPTTGGPVAFDVAVTDSNPNGADRIQIAVTLNVSTQTMSISPTPGLLPRTAVGAAYSQKFAASGGVAPYIYSLVPESDALPGLSLNSTTGILSGTPTAGGTFSFGVLVTDSLAGGFSSLKVYYTLVVKPLSITTSGLPDGTAGAAYRQTITVAGSPGNLTFSMTGEPAGLNLSPGGVLSGTPTQTGSFYIRITVRDSVSGDSDSRDFTLLIGAPAIVLAPASLPNPVFGIYYSQSVSASGGVQPFSYSLLSGDVLPDGLRLSPGGEILGAPTKPGDFSFTIVATDNSTGAGAPFSTSKTYTMKIAAPTLSIAPAALAKGVVGTTYSQTLTAWGGAGGYVFSVASADLPKGLVLDPGGTLSGTPTQVGSYTFTVTATDSHGSTGERNYTVAINDSATGGIRPNILADATVGTPYSQAFTASGGIGPYTFSRSLGNAPPPGLKVSADGTLSGTPTATGRYTFSIVAKDSATSSWMQRLSLVVTAPTISLAPSALPNATGGVAYSQKVTASGGTAPYSFSVGGKLPDGLSLSSDGTLSGVPTTSGSFDFTITATDKTGGKGPFTGSLAYRLVVDAPVPVATDISMDLLAGTSAKVNLTAIASGGPFTAAAIVATPAAADGSARIEGSGASYDLVFASTASASGAVVVTYTLSNRWGVSAPATVTFNVSARPDPAQDPEVTGLVAAQVDAANRLAASQTRNFNGRLEQLHDENQRHANPVSVQLGLTSDANRPLGYAQDDRDRQQSGTTLGFPMDRLAGRQGETPKAMAFWAGGFVNFGQRDGAIDFKQTLVGVSGGVDYRFSPRFVGGIGFGYGRDSADIGSNGTRNEAAALSVAAYGSYSPVADVFIDGLLGYSRLDFDSRRFVTASGDFASGARDGQQVFGSLATAYEHRWDGWLLSPYGRLEASWSRLDTYTEAGAGLFNLVYGEQSLTTLAGVLGLRARYAMATDWGVFTPKARLEYTHDFSGSSRASMGYADLGNGLPYGFDIEASVRDHFGIGLGFDASFGDGWLLGFDYSTALATSGSSQDHSIAVRIGSRW